MVYNPRMAELGRYNRLRIVKRADIGIFLDGGEFGEILLPRKYVQDSMQVGDDVEVFVYNDSEDRIIATTQRPKTQVGECAYLKVVGTSKFGAFLDWGAAKTGAKGLFLQRLPVCRRNDAAHRRVDQARRSPVAGR
jgi:predicted RNA-binding protein (virulence factor B family)